MTEKGSDELMDDEVMDRIRQQVIAESQEQENDIDDFAEWYRKNKGEWKTGE